MSKARYEYEKRANQLSLEMKETLRMVAELSTKVKGAKTPKPKTDVGFAALKEAFVRFDVDGDGKITKEEFMHLCSQCNDVSVPVSWIMDDLQVDSSGYILWDDFAASKDWRPFFLWASAHAKSKSNLPSEHDWDMLCTTLRESQDMGALAERDAMSLEGRTSDADNDEEEDWDIGYIFQNEGDRIEEQQAEIERHMHNAHELREQLAWSRNKISELTAELDASKRNASLLADFQKEQRSRMEAYAADIKKAAFIQRKFDALLLEVKESRAHDPFLELKAAFRAFDANGDGKITKEEFKEMCNDCELSMPVDWIMGDVDTDDDGFINWEEFSHASDWKHFFKWVFRTGSGGTPLPTASSMDLRARCELAEETVDDLRAENDELRKALRSHVAEGGKNNIGATGIAIIDVVGQGESDLSFPAGALICSLHRTEEEDYLTGSYNGKVGFLPIAALSRDRKTITSKDAAQ